MRISSVYFEDVFSPIKNLWKGQYELTYGNKSKSFVESLRDDYHEVEYIVDVERKGEYNEWHSMMFFVMYQVLTETSLRLLKQGIYTFNMDDVPVEDFERKYLENLQAEGNERFLAKYRGLMP